MFDGVFDVFAEVLNFFYTLIPNYAIAIALLTLLVMVITTPFTLKGTRSMIQMQRLQPEMRKLQVKYKDDRQKLNEELMAFYKENNLNPLGGCLPLLLQTPIFIILYNVIQGLTRNGEDGTFDPKYLKHSSELYQALNPVDEMVAFGVDLAVSARRPCSEGFVDGLPYVRHGRGRGPDLLLPAEADPGPQPERRDAAAAEDDDAGVPGHVRGHRVHLAGGAGRVLHDLEPLPDRDAGLHHPNPLPRGGLARCPGPPRRRRGQEAEGGGGRPGSPAEDRQARGRQRTPKGDAPEGDKGTTPSGSNGADAAPKGPPEPTSRTTPPQNRSKKKKRRR